MTAGLRSVLATVLLAVTLIAGLSSCATSGSGGDATLYRDVGGEAGVAKLVSRLLDRVYADPRIASLFADSDREDLQRLIEEQFCAEFGGGCTYTGRSMTESHGGLAIKHKEFEAFVEDLILAMEDVELGTRTQNRILAIFAPMRAEVVDQ